MPSYIVTWTIDADEFDNPHAAAVHARAAQIRPGTWANVFDVKDKATGETTRVDLDEDEDEDHAANVSKPGAHTVPAQEGEPASYRVAVDYQTASGGGTRFVNVNATNWTDAIAYASALVRNRRGVLKVSGGSSMGRPVRLAR
jgi:hypothetical protein